MRSSSFFFFSLGDWFEEKILKREENFFFENQFRVYVLFGPPLLKRYFQR